MDEFEQMAADLEKSVKADEVTALSPELQELLKDPENVKKALALGAEALAKAKGAQPTDLSQEKAPKKKTVTETEDDPAEEPVKSGKGYKDTRPYVGKGCDGDDDDGDGKPDFFKKKKKKMKKSDDDDDDDGDDPDVEDVTEFMGQMAKAMNFIVDEIVELKKGQQELTEGSAIFGQVLHTVAETDPRRDTLFLSMAKALTSVVENVKDLKKSAHEQVELAKSISQMPGAPRVAGLHLMKSEADNAAAAAAGQGGTKVSEGDRQRLFQAAVRKSITTHEYKNALATGDVSVLEKIK